MASSDSVQISTGMVADYGSSNVFASRQQHDQQYDEVSPVRKEHLGANRQYWRDMILGVNDGLISTFLLVAGVGGGGLSSRDILLTGIAGALAGAVSMCTY